MIYYRKTLFGCGPKLTAVHYKEIYALEESLKGKITDYQVFKNRLDQLDIELRDLKLPFIHDQFVQEIFIVREHLELVKRKIDFV